LAGLGVAAGVLALSLALSMGPAAAEVPDVTGADMAASAVDPGAATSPLAVFRATTSMTSAQADVCHVVSIDSWRAPAADSGRLTPANGMGTASGTDRPIVGPTLSSDALPGDGKRQSTFTLGEHACNDELPSSPTYELASTPD